MKQGIVSTAIFFVFILGCATLSDPITTYPIGKTFQGMITFNYMDIPLPPGEWKTIGRGITVNNFFYEIFLFNPESEDIIYIERESPVNTYRGYVHSKYLARKDLHHVVVKNNNRGEAQNGWLINHYRLSIDTEHGQARREAREYIIKNNYAFAGNYIQTHHRFAGNTLSPSQYLEFNHFRNPETAGIKPPANANWGASDWHPLRINNFPEKKAYIEKVKQEGASMHARLESTFNTIVSYPPRKNE